MALVLCAGVDRSLITTRKLILQRAGHKVITAMTDDEIVRQCERNNFDVIVIGQIAPRHFKQRTMGAIRESCASAKVLELYTVTTGRLLPDADDWLQVPTDVPPDFAERVSQLAARR